jgi:hypothetical protein
MPTVAPNGLAQLIKSNRNALACRAFMLMQLIYAVEMFKRFISHKLTYDFATYSVGRVAIFTVLAGLSMLFEPDKAKLHVSTIILVVIPMAFVVTVFWASFIR